MKVCIPTEDGRGLESAVSQHFGSAAFYTLIDPQSGAVECVPNGAEASGHHGGCASVGLVRELAADVVLCRGLGRRALERFESLGIRVYATDAPDVRSAVAAFRGSGLEAFAPAAVCQGHRDHHGGCHH